MGDVHIDLLLCHQWLMPVNDFKFNQLYFILVFMFRNKSVWCKVHESSMYTDTDNIVGHVSLS